MEHLPRLTGCRLAPDDLNSRRPMLACPHHWGETPTTLWGVGSRTSSPPGSTTSDERTFHVGWVDQYVAVSHCHAISHNVNTVLLQCAPNLFNLLLIHTTNANATVDITITVLNNFEIKRDTVQTKNDFPAQ